MFFFVVWLLAQAAYIAGVLVAGTEPDPWTFLWVPYTTTIALFALVMVAVAYLPVKEG